MKENTGDKQGAGGTGFVDFSTSSQRQPDQFDYWRGLYPSVTLEPAERSNCQAFRGDIARFTASNKCTFAVSRYDDTVGRFGRSGSDYLLFTAGIGGDALAEDERGNPTVSALNGGLVIIDPTYLVQTRTRNVSQISLIVPRASFEEGAGDALKRNEGGVLALPEGGVTSFLLAQMHMLARQVRTIDAMSAEVVMHTMADMAVAALTQAGSGDDSAGEGGLMAAARSFIALHLGDNDLTAARIARAVGCSRAQLFRVFERHNQSIGYTIRQSRIDYARYLLATDHSLAVEQVAYHCGYANAAAFTRAFRLDVGMTPLAYRHEDGQSSISPATI